MNHTSIQLVDVIEDGRVDCISCFTIMTISDYISLVKVAYDNKGGIEGQRDVLTTSTAVRIRNRMVQDIQRGAVLPPVVLGMLFEGSDALNSASLLDSPFYEKINRETISIIDGMQRTTALIQAANNNSQILSNKIRVEFWLSNNSNSLLYRMLVLNTGQVPWNLKRQIEVVFNSMTMEIEQNCPNVKLLTQKRRRWSGGQFQVDSAIEMYLAFGARKENVDTKERLTDEFVRLDFIEATSERHFTQQFFKFFDLLSQIDIQLDRFNVVKVRNLDSNSKFSIGRDLFSSQPACIGFATAVAERVYGRPGLDKTPQQVNEEFQKITADMVRFISKLRNLSSDEIKDLLDYGTLNQTLTVKSSRQSVGEHERAFFKNAFKVIIEERFDISRLTPAWRV